MRSQQLQREIPVLLEVEQQTEQLQRVARDVVQRDEVLDSGMLASLRLSDPDDLCQHGSLVLLILLRAIREFDEEWKRREKIQADLRVEQRLAESRNDRSLPSNPPSNPTS